MNAHRVRLLLFITTLVAMHPVAGISAERCPCTDAPPFRDRPPEAVAKRIRALPTAEVIERLRHGSCAIAIEAAGVLDARDDSSAVPALLEALDGPRCKVRVAAASALGSFCRDDVRTALLSVLHTSDRRVRAAAASSLDRQRDDASLVTQSLIRALSDSSKHVRQAAAESLGDIGNPAAEDALVRALGDTSKHVREAAAQALGKLRGR